jgi:hypothetical protein
MAHDPVTAGIDLVKTFVGKFVKDKDLAAKLTAQADSEEFKGNLSLLTGQMEVNKIEAAHKSVFVSGWRPFIGWVCGVSLAYNFIIYPMLSFVVTVFVEEPPVLPVLDAAQLMTLVTGMLGLAATRSHDKAKGVDS